MGQTAHMRKVYRIVLSIMVLAVFLAAQYESMVQTMNQAVISERADAGGGSLDPSLRTWIYEDNSAETTLFFFERSELERMPGMAGYLGDREDLTVLQFALAQIWLVQLFLVGFGLRRQFIRDLERETVPIRYERRLLRLRHRSDGEKEKRYNFAAG